MLGFLRLLHKGQEQKPFPTVHPHTLFRLVSYNWSSGHISTWL